MTMDSDTRQQLLDSIQRFVRDRLVPLEDQVAETGLVPDDVVQEMRELGLFGLTIPEEFGGLGLSMEDEALVVMELGQASPAFRAVIGTTVGIGSQGVIRYGSAEQKQEWLPRLATGEAISAFCLTEAEAGSDAASLRTKATLDGDSYVLNGTKRFITNAKRAGVFTVMARTNPDNPGAGGISAFIVPADTPGLSLGPLYKKMGQAGAQICDVVFDDCRIPAANLLGEEGQGFRAAMQILERGRLHIAALCVGVAERILRESVNYAVERKQFGQPIGEFQLIQGMLADSRTEIYAGRSMVMEASREVDAGNQSGTNISCSKYFCSEMVGRVADRAVQIFGGAGYVADYGIERFYRDVRVFRIYEGTSQIQQVIIARNLLREAGA